MGQLFYVESDNNVTGSTSIHESKKPSEVACVEKVEREENLKKGNVNYIK